MEESRRNKEERKRIGSSEGRGAKREITEEEEKKE